MSWVAITEAALLTHITGAELESLRAAALGATQVDPVAPSISQVTDLVRGYVAACAKNVLDTTTTNIPARLLSAACDLVVAEIINRVEGYNLSENRQDKVKASTKLLESVALCKFAIEDPTTGLDTGPDIEEQHTERVATRESMDGL